MDGAEPEKMKKIFGAITDLRDSFNNLDSLLSSGPASYWFKRMEEYVDGLFSFSKFKIGDRVELAKDVDCSDKPGWRGCEHFLKAGAKATINDISFSKSGFGYGVQFDVETWMDKKVARPVGDKHQFWFQETSLVAAWH